MGARRGRRDCRLKKRDLERHLAAHGCRLAREALSTSSGRTRPADSEPRFRGIVRSSGRPREAPAVSSGFRRPPGVVDRERRCLSPAPLRACRSRSTSGISDIESHHQLIAANDASHAHRPRLQGLRVVGDFSRRTPPGAASLEEHPLASHLVQGSEQPIDLLVDRRGAEAVWGEAVEVPGLS